MKVYDFTDEDLLNAVLDEVVEHPGFKYFGNDVGTPETPKVACQYLNDDDEGECIMGCALVRIGVDPEDIKPEEGNGVCTVIFALRGLKKEDARPRNYTEILSFLDGVQSNQDLNYSWAESLSIEKNRLDSESKILKLLAAKDL